MPDSPDTCGRKPKLQTKRRGLKNIWMRVDGALKRAVQFDSRASEFAST